LAVVAGFVIRVFGIMKVIGLRSLNLVIQVAGLRLSTLPQSVFKELNQPVDQPLLPAYDVETALMAVLLKNFTDTAFQVSHHHTS
jgi:hypothetical protein